MADEVDNLTDMITEERRLRNNQAAARHRERKRAKAQGTEGPPLQKRGYRPRFDDPEESKERTRKRRREWCQRPDVKARQKEQHAARRQLAREVYYAAKDNPCVDCTTKFHPIAMDFDHRDGEVKRRDVAKLVAIGAAVATVIAEITKCDLVCANCHRVRTAVRNGWHDPLEGE